MKAEISARNGHYENQIEILRDKSEYWNARCELSELMYSRLNMNEYHGEEYEKWEALKQKLPQRVIEGLRRFSYFR